MYSYDVIEKMEKAIETGNLETVLQTASDLGVDLKDEWVSTAAEAIVHNFPELLKYLQQELQINFPEGIGKLSFDDREEIDHSVCLAAQYGNCEIIDYVIREFKSRQTFNAAFIGAAGNHQEKVLHLLYRFLRSGDFTIGNDILNNALAAACGNQVSPIEALTDFSTQSPGLEKDAYGSDAVDKLMEQTLTTVSLLLTGKKNEYCGWTDTLDKAEQLVRLLKTCRKADKGKMLFLFGKRFLYDQEMRLPDFIKTEIMKKTCCPWLEPESTDQMPSLRILRGRLKHIRKRLICGHLFQADERIEKSGIPRDRQRRIHRQVVHSLIAAYRDADSIADFHKRAQAYAEEILRDLFFIRGFIR